ncbi:uncharacterized protein F4822DRAFT_89615 [Hypoxylon trugodes]|uniref:uncharacterized protein n=1 Tax=Hypoxylon trugodes TaxID=326681 RepID=UPI002190C306|nr:uncharacterized protein F4822DRAFT_89615 [Hypoxylon trugodes]KAI1383013.1 hypothetical protein F4822DRAFT_89615 [Hypoxylon trugodes]
MKFITLLALTTNFSPAVADPLLEHRAANTTGPPFPAKTIFQFNETNTWIENLAIRPNGDLLLTLLTPDASLYTVKQPYSPSPTLSRVHFFDNATSLTGIAEIQPDTFIILAAQYHAVGDPIPGSAIVWEVSFHSSSSSAPSIRKTTDFPEVQLANGVAFVPSSVHHGSDVVLISDSYGSCLWRLDTRTGAYEMVLKVSEMMAPAGSVPPLGIDGLKVHGGYVYWGNWATAGIYRVRIDAQGYPVTNSTNSTAEVEKVVSLVPESDHVDDFAFDRQGLLWTATNDGNIVAVVRAGGSFEAVVGGAEEDIVAGDTAIAFGRTALDRDVVYVSTSGSLLNNQTEPAKVVAVNRAAFR